MHKVDSWSFLATCFGDYLECMDGPQVPSLQARQTPSLPVTLSPTQSFLFPAISFLPVGSKRDPQSTFSGPSTSGTCLQVFHVVL